MVIELLDASTNKARMKQETRTDEKQVSAVDIQSVSLSTGISNKQLFHGLDIREPMLLGAIRGLGRIPLEHPFDLIKTVHQSNPAFPNTRAVIKNLYERNGLRELYRGAIPNALRTLIKESYRSV